MMTVLRTVLLLTMLTALATSRPKKYLIETVSILAQKLLDLGIYDILIQLWLKNT